MFEWTAWADNSGILGTSPPWDIPTSTPGCTSHSIPLTAFHKWGLPKKNGWFISWKIPFKWMVWGYPYFRKPYIHEYIIYIVIWYNLQKWGYCNLNYGPSKKCETTARPYASRTASDRPAAIRGTDELNKGLNPSIHLSLDCTHFLYHRKLHGIIDLHVRCGMLGKHPTNLGDLLPISTTNLDQCKVFAGSYQEWFYMILPFLQHKRPKWSTVEHGFPGTTPETHEMFIRAAGLLRVSWQRGHGPWRAHEHSLRPLWLGSRARGRSWTKNMLWKVWFPLK